MIGFQRGQIVKVNVEGHSRYKPDEKIIVLIPNGAVEHYSLIHDRYGTKYLMVTKLEYYETYKHYPINELIEMWRNVGREDFPIYVFDYKEFELFPSGNAQNAPFALEALE